MHGGAPRRREMHAEMVNELVHSSGRRAQMKLIVQTATDGRVTIDTINC